MNTTTAASTNFILANPTNDDVRVALGITNDRASEIIDLIHTGAKAEKYGANITGQMWISVGNLPTEAERLFGAWAIGHGMGLNNDDDNTDGPFGGGDNPLAALLAEMQKQANNSDGDSIPDDDSEEL